ncbi:MAG TPA: glutaredoxin family protein [Salinimicrobium catena]|uniref:Glutaredoxin family protein n=1 Tax=Salinimicrobium catena TaxID=390640 RepID=A0A7C2M8G0_9FLAO|nr:glutaredoxin family protein [Salinimicrobium catena]
MKTVLIIIGMSIIALQLCLVPVASAKLYTWVDRNGVTRRTYYPPPKDQVGNRNQVQKPRVQQQKTVNQVELYVTSWCPYCKQAINFFRSRGVEIKVYDIEKDRNAAARKKQLNGKGGVPFAVINGKQITGYAPSQYTQALK